MSYLFDEEKTWTERDFGLDRRLIKAIAKIGFIYPTIVQSKCIPIALQGKDVLVRARTGSGKTYSYVLPVIHKLLCFKENVELDNNIDNSKIYSIILAPSKELCKQIEKNINEIIYYCKDSISVTSLVSDSYDNVNNKSKFKSINQSDIIISTPLKLNELLKLNLLNISNIKILVIDEADLILSFGYSNDIQSIISHMPKIFQGILMSATLSPELDKFKRIVLNNPAILKLEEPLSSGKLLQFYIACVPLDKYLILYVFLRLGLLQGKGLIFANDVNKCYRLKLFLKQFHINAAVLNAEMPLNSRLHILEEFNRGVFDYLIASDASVDDGDDDDDEEEDESDDENTKKAHKKSTVPLNNNDEYGVHRGMDFQNVSFVINFDFPKTSAAYTHRIGRTARAGSSGTALSFISLPEKTFSKHDKNHSERDMEVLKEVRSQQPRLDPTTSDMNILASINTNTIDNVINTSIDEEKYMQPCPLLFNMKKIETFRYRVNDVVKNVTGIAVKELRAAELKHEILNSKKLKNFFNENPNDFKVLRHDNAIAHPVKIKEHLKVIPDYLIPQSMKSFASTDLPKRKKRKQYNSLENRIYQSKQRDPLHNPSIALDGIDGNDNNKSVNNTKVDLYTTKEVNNVNSSSMSGRKLWKMKHHKGKFNTKKNNKKSKK